MNTPIKSTGKTPATPIASTKESKPTALGTLLSIEKSETKPKAFAKSRAALNLTKNVLTPLILGQTYKRIMPQVLRSKSLDDYVERTTNIMALQEIILPLMKWAMKFIITPDKINSLENLIGQFNISALLNSSETQVNTPQPAAKVSLPQTQVNTPQPAAKVSLPQTQVNTPQPAAKVSLPQTQVNTPQPAAKVSLPQTQVNTPQPAAKVSLPQTQVNTPQPAAKVSLPQAQINKQPPVENTLTWIWYTFVAGYVSNPDAMRSILEEVTGIDTILKNKFSFLSSEKMWGGDTLRRAVINCMHLLMDVFLISPSRLQSQKAKYSWPGAVLASNFIGGVRIGEYFNASYMKKMGLGALGMFASYGSVVSTVALATSVTGITNLSTFSTMGLMLQSSALYIKDPKLQALLTAGNIGFQFLGPLTTIYQAVDSATGLGSILALSTLTGGGLLYLHAKHPEILKSLGERSDDFNPMDWYTAEDFSKQKGSIEKNDFNPDNLAENNYRFKQKAFNLIQEAMNAIELNAEKQQTLLSELEELKKEGERLKWLEGSPQPKAKNTESKYHARRVENLQAIQKKESEIQELVTQSNALYENYNKIIAENPILSLEVAKLEVMRLKILQEAINQEMTALEEKNKSIASSKKNQTSALSWLNQLLEKQREVLPQNSKNDKKLQEAFKRTHGERIHKELQQIQSNTQEMFQQFWQFAETLDEATQEDLKKEWTDHFKSPLGLSYGNLLNKTEQHQFENIHKQQIFLQKHLDQVIKKVQGSLDDQVKTAEKDVNIKAEAEAAQFRKALEERIENTRIPDIVLGTPEETINTRDATSPEDAVNPPNTEAIEAQFQATHQEFVTETLETIVTAVQGIQDGYASDKDIREKLSNLHEGLQAQLQAAEVAEEQRQVELGDVGDQEDPIAQLRNKHREAMQKTLSEIQDINVTRLNPLGKGSRLTIEAIKERNERGQEIIVGEKIHAGHYIPVSIKEEDAPSLLKAAPESHENEINQESLSATEEQSERSADLEEHGADNSLNNLQEILKNLMAAKPVVKRLDSQEEIDPITLPALKEKLTAFAADTNRQEGFNDDIFLHEKVFIQDKSLKKMEERWREEPENSLRLEEYSIENRFNNLKAIFNDNEKLTNFASNLFSPKSMEAYEGALQGIIAPRVDSDQLIVVNDAEGSTRKLKIDLKPEYQFKILPPEEGLNFMQVSIEGTYKALGEWQVEKDEIVDYSLEKQENSFVRTHVLVKIAYQEPEAKKGWFSWWKASDNLTFTPSLSYAGIIAKVSEEIQAPQADLSAL